MDTQSGEATGRIWQYLAAHGEAPLPQLRRGTTLPERPLLLEVGWLARADPLGFVQERRGLKLSLHAQRTPR